MSLLKRRFHSKIISPNSFDFDQQNHFYLLELPVNVHESFLDFNLHHQQLVVYHSGKHSRQLSFNQLHEIYLGIICTVQT